MKIDFSIIPSQHTIDFDATVTQWDMNTPKEEINRVLRRFLENKYYFTLAGELHPEARQCLYVDLQEEKIPQNILLSIVKCLALLAPEQTIAHYQKIMAAPFKSIQYKTFFVEGLFIAASLQKLLMPTSSWHYLLFLNQANAQVMERFYALSKELCKTKDDLFTPVYTAWDETADFKLQPIPDEVGNRYLRAHPEKLHSFYTQFSLLIHVMLWQAGLAQGSQLGSGRDGEAGSEAYHINELFFGGLAYLEAQYQLKKGANSFFESVGLQETIKLLFKPQRRSDYCSDNVSALIKKALKIEAHRIVLAATQLTLENYHKNLQKPQKTLPLAEFIFVEEMGDPEEFITYFSQLHEENRSLTTLASQYVPKFVKKVEIYCPENISLAKYLHNLWYSQIPDTVFEKFLYDALVQENKFWKWVRNIEDLHLLYKIFRTVSHPELDNWVVENFSKFNAKFHHIQNFLVFFLDARSLAVGFKLKSLYSDSLNKNLLLSHLCHRTRAELTLILKVFSQEIESKFSQYIDFSLGEIVIMRSTFDCEDPDTYLSFLKYFSFKQFPGSNQLLLWIIKRFATYAQDDLMEEFILALSDKMQKNNLKWQDLLDKHIEIPTLDFYKKLLEYAVFYEKNSSRQIQYLMTEMIKRCRELCAGGGEHVFSLMKEIESLRVLKNIYYEGNKTLGHFLLENFTVNIISIGNLWNLIPIPSSQEKLAEIIKTNIALRILAVLEDVRVSDFYEGRDQMNESLFDYVIKNNLFSDSGKQIIFANKVIKTYQFLINNNIDPAILNHVSDILSLFRFINEGKLSCSHKESFGLFFQLSYITSGELNEDTISVLIKDFFPKTDIYQFMEEISWHVKNNFSKKRVQHLFSATLSLFKDLRIVNSFPLIYKNYFSNVLLNLIRYFAPDQGIAHLHTLYHSRYFNIQEIFFADILCGPQEGNAFSFEVISSILFKPSKNAILPFTLILETIHGSNLFEQLYIATLQQQDKNMLEKTQKQLFEKNSERYVHCLLTQDDENLCQFTEFDLKDIEILLTEIYISDKPKNKVKWLLKCLALKVFEAEATRITEKIKFLLRKKGMSELLEVEEWLRLKTIVAKDKSCLENIILYSSGEAVLIETLILYFALPDHNKWILSEHKSLSQENHFKIIEKVLAPGNYLQYKKIFLYKKLHHQFMENDQNEKETYIAQVKNYFSKHPEAKEEAYCFLLTLIEDENHFLRKAKKNTFLLWDFTAKNGLTKSYMELLHFFETQFDDEDILKIVYSALEENREEKTFLQYRTAHKQPVNIPKKSSGLPLGFLSTEQFWSFESSEILKRKTDHFLKNIFGKQCSDFLKGCHPIQERKPHGLGSFQYELAWRAVAKITEEERDFILKRWQKLIDFIKENGGQPRNLYDQLLPMQWILKNLQDLHNEAKERTEPQDGVNRVLRKFRQAF